MLDALITELSGLSAINKGDVLDLSNLINPCDTLKAQRQERRASERIQKAMNMEGKPQGKSSNKRSLEGNINTSSNFFSILSNDDLVDKSIAMGVNINCGDYSSIDMLRNLEDARNALYNKKIQQE